MSLPLSNLKNRPYALLGLGLVFLLAIFLCYSPAVYGFFVSDDWHWLGLAQERPWSAEIFTTNYEGLTGAGSYNPLLFILFKIFYSLLGLNHIGFHLVSLLLHFINGILVYFLAQKIFYFLAGDYKRPASFLAAAWFLFWPTQVEAIAWLSAWPHLWATTFYLWSLLSYFHFKENRGDKYLCWSILCFLLALLIKETALSLPLVILFLELYQYIQNRKYEKRPGVYGFYLQSLGIITLLFLAVRFGVTGTLFGYYGQEQLGWSIRLWLANLAGYLNDLVSFSHLREIFFRIWYKDLTLVAVLVASALLVYILFLILRRKFQELVLFFLFSLALLPFLPLGLNRLTFEGERYLYLPSIFFLIYLANLLFTYLKNIKVIKLIASILLLVSFFIVYSKAQLWQKAGQIAQNIVESGADLSLKDDQTLVSLALPDNFQGAQVFRNNLKQALDFHYPDKDIKIIPLPVYVRLTEDNYNKPLLIWRRDERGWFGESADGEYVVTGITSIEREGFYWELWNYNYQNYTANTIRLMPQTEELKDKLESGEIKILTFDQGILKILE